MEEEISSAQIKEKIRKLYSRNLIDQKTAREILLKLEQESSYEKKFFKELLKRLNERLDFKLERGMINFLKKNLR